MKIAVCTSDGNRVDTHFGRTSRFYIYELKGRKMTQLEIRNVERYCSFSSPEHKFGSDRFWKVYDVIKDCGTIFTAKVGDVPKKKLQGKGMNVVEGEVPVTSLVELMD